MWPPHEKVFSARWFLQNVLLKNFYFVKNIFLDWKFNNEGKVRAKIGFRNFPFLRFKSSWIICNESSIYIDEKLQPLQAIVRNSAKRLGWIWLQFDPSWFSICEFFNCFHSLFNVILHLRASKNSLKQREIVFLRFFDKIIFFCESKINLFHHNQNRINWIWSEN